MSVKFHANNFFASHKHKFFVIMIVVALQSISCNIINPAEPVPAYVHVDSISLSTDYLTQGSSSHKIVDAWVYVDGSIIGTYEMPVTLPVLKAGSHTLTIRPGILINGIAATRTAYPFYTGYDLSVNFESQKIITVQPKVTYTSNAQIEKEDFDGTGISFKKYTGSDTTITPVHDQHSFEGYYGAVYLDAAHSFFAGSFSDSILLQTSAPAYVELNYLCDNEFTVGLITYTASNKYYDNIVTFKASGTWKKEYVNLTPYVGSTTNILGYNIFIKANLATGSNNASLYFDNIKLVR